MEYMAEAISVIHAIPIVLIGVLAHIDNVIGRTRNRKRRRGDIKSNPRQRYAWSGSWGDVGLAGEGG